MDQARRALRSRGLSVTASKRVNERVSRLELTFRQRDAQDGSQTYLAEQYVGSPLKILRPFEVGGGRVVLQLLNVGPGVMQGDRYNLSVRVQSGAKVVLVNQSATKLHTMPSGSASQNITVHVERGAELEYYPGLVIPYRDADFTQRTDVHLEEGARFGTLERFVMGRTAHGEAFGFRRLSSRLRIYRDDTLVYGDGLELPSERTSHLGLTDRSTYLAAGVWLWGEQPEFLEESRETVRPEFGQAALVQGGFGAGLYLRGLDADGLEQTWQLEATLRRWREGFGLPTLYLSRFGWHA